jgi:hypothetical protein
MQSEEVKQLAYFIMDRNIQLGNTLTWSYVKDGNEPMFKTEILRSYKKKSKKAIENLDSASMFGGKVVNTKVDVDGSGDDVEAYLNDESTYSDKKKYPLIITEWIFNPDRLSRKTFKGEELEKEKSDQTIFHDIEDRVEIRYNNILSDVNTARSKEGESDSLSTEIGKASEESVESNNSNCEATDSDSDSDESIDDESENSDAEGFMNHPITNSAEAIAQAASEDSGNLTEKIKTANKTKKTVSTGTNSNKKSNMILGAW